MTDFKYPGYVPMTDDELKAASWTSKGVQATFTEAFRAIEQAVLSRLPKPSGEPVAWKYAHNTFTFTNSKATADECPADWIPLYTHPKPDTAERDAELAKYKQAVADILALPEIGIYDSTNKFVDALLYKNDVLKIIDKLGDA